jgi:hypothetical protein
MKNAFRSLAFAAFFSAAGAAQSADLVTMPVTPYCALAQNAQILHIPDNASLSSEVVRLMDESIAVSESPQWINSRRPAFIWASEAKAACGIAYGYLRASYRDHEFLNKCECFHARMLHYMHR